MERRMVVTQRDCAARLVPVGTPITIPKDTFVTITQDLGGNYTVTVTDDRLCDQILSTESDDVPVHIVTTLGELNLEFDDFSLLLDNGRRITFLELCDACENYWNRWENEAKQNKTVVDNRLPAPSLNDNTNYNP